MSSPTPLQRKTLAMAAAFAVVMSLLLILSLAGLAGPPDLGAYTVSRGDGTQLIAWTMPGGHASEAGLWPGDVVRPVDPPPGSGAWEALAVVEGPREGNTVLFTRRWPLVVDLLLLLLGLEFLAVGLVVFLRATDRPAANRFAVLAAACAASLSVLPAGADGQPWALYLEWLGSMATMASLVGFCLTTPVERWSHLRRILIWAPVPILVFYTYTVLGRPEDYWIAKTLGYSYMAVGAFTSLAAMLVPFLTRAPGPQKKLLPVLACAAIAGGLLLFGILLPRLLFHATLVPIEVVAASFGLIPFGFLWAVYRYPLMGITFGPGSVIKTVFETITDPIFVVNQQGKLVDASQAGLALLGVEKVKDATEPVEQVLARLRVPAQGIQSTNAEGSLLDRVLRGEVIRDEELDLQLEGGELLCMSVAGNPLYNERGQIDMGVLVLRNITERKRRETARRDLERQKDEFLANVSHDLRTPLSAIKFSVGAVLANEPPNTPEPIHKLLSNVQLSAEGMSAMVEDILELTRIGSGRTQLHTSRCDLRHLVHRACSTIEPLAEARGQRLEVDLPPEPLPMVADAGRLERAIANLVGNANKYGKSAGVIRVVLRHQPLLALISVTDDGPGIPEAEQEKIFQRFYRVKKDGARAGTGIGLGLPIARAMVELHGGRLWVESQPRQGSTFWIALPTERSGNNPRGERPVETSTERGGG